MSGYRSLAGQRHAANTGMEAFARESETESRCHGRRSDPKTGTRKRVIAERQPITAPFSSCGTTQTHSRSCEKGGSFLFEVGYAKCEAKIGAKLLTINDKTDLDSPLPGIDDMKW